MIALLYVHFTPEMWVCTSVWVKRKKPIHTGYIYIHLATMKRHVSSQMATLCYWSAWLTFRSSGDILKLLQRNVTWVTAQDLDIKSITRGGERDSKRDGERQREWGCLWVELSKGPLERKVLNFFFFALSHHSSLLASPLLQKYAALVHPASTRHSHCNI